MTKDEKEAVLSQLKDWIEKEVSAIEVEIKMLNNSAHTFNQVKMQKQQSEITRNQGKIEAYEEILQLIERELK